MKFIFQKYLVICFTIVFASDICFGWTNTGNNPGNPNAAGYGTGGNAPTSGSGNNNNSYNNTGNNPGNPNAAGYGTGGNAPTSGSGNNNSYNSNSNNMGGSDDDDDSYQNTGNNPGNINAPGYNTGGNNTSNNNSNNTSVAGVSFYQGVTNLAINTVRAVTNTVEVAAKNAYGAVSPHYKAVVAGIQARESSIRGTIGVDSYGSELAMKSAFYKGVKDSYNKQGIWNTWEMPVPSGPMMEFLSKNPSLKPAVGSTAETYMDEFDKAARNGAFYLVPGQVTNATASRLIGDYYYSNMSTTQRLGLQTSFTIVGQVGSFDDTFFCGAGAIGCSDHETFSGSAPGGVIVVGIQGGPQNFPNIGSILIHEASHSGDRAISTFMNNYVNSNSFLPGSDEVKAKHIFNEVAKFGTEEHAMNVLKSAGQTPWTKIGGVMDEKRYWATLSEIIAFKATPGNIAAYIALISQELQIGDQEASAIASDIMNSETIKYVEYQQNKFAPLFLK